MPNAKSATTLNKLDHAIMLNDARSLQQELFSDLNFTNKNQYRVFPFFAYLCDFATKQGCKSILEIGAGLSTAVWARMAQQTGADVYSVDADLSRIQSYIRNSGHAAMVAKHVNMIEGATIQPDELIDFYTNQPMPTYGGMDSRTVLDHVDLLRSKDCSFKRWRRTCRFAGQKDWSARSLMAENGVLAMPRKLIDLYSNKRNFDNEILFLQHMDAQGKSDVITELSKQVKSWDLIFFDSGELASMVEWLRLKDDIAVGGFAAFHDIFFPKSIKNIVPCAAVLADPDWKLVFFDNSTRQGLLVAQRLR